MTYCWTPRQQYFFENLAEHFRQNISARALTFQLALRHFGSRLDPEKNPTLPSPKLFRSFLRATAPFTGNWVRRKAHFNIQMDKVSWKLWVFLVELCFIEAKASLCFAKIRRDPSSPFSLIFGSARKKRVMDVRTNTPCRVAYSKLNLYRQGWRMWHINPKMGSKYYIVFRREPI